MRSPLKKFTAFTSLLLPNEASYLLSIQRFGDKDRLNILHRIHYNAHQIDQFTPYDTSIDKRKYNHLQNWIVSRLQSIDVDEQFNRMSIWEQKIISDSIQVEEEKDLLKLIKKYQQPVFFFSKFYEIVENYRHFLLIRLRYSDYELVDSFLKNNRESYDNSKKIKEKIHQASLIIVEQYAGKVRESKQWEEWLSEVFYNEKIEGHIRYLALVRLVFICHNYREYDLLKDKFDFLEKKMSEGFFYSKRLLANYNNNRLMMHSHFKEYDKALHYGSLSVKNKTHDYLLYVNNFCAVLMRLERNQEALNLVQDALSHAKKTKNFHNRIGFVAYYMKALYKNGFQKNAEQYGDTFLKVYSKEVLQYRWYLYFTVYFEILFHQKRFNTILKICGKYRLIDRDKIYKSNTKNYYPIIPLYEKVARWLEGDISKKYLMESIKVLLHDVDIHENSSLHIFISALKEYIPEISSLRK